VVKAVKERDARDKARDLAPLLAARDAVLLDSTGQTCEEVVDRMEKHVRSRL